ncbi:MAG: hypothetical protein COT16_01565 [Elusimicrobia bacterium CG08_land_8_20_14_0_20_44_26]|nr:MAG: hypothetical protein COT16_01565 [Elusimicrobia bacterium CG08_land_8_20_14_0_20_44_26]
MFVIGIDENGLGPRLGVFCVTASVFECVKYDRGKFWKCAGKTGVADSKKIVFSGRTKKGRGIASIFLKSASGKIPSDERKFVGRLSFSGCEPFNKKCPQICAGMCRGQAKPFETPPEVDVSAQKVRKIMKKNGIRFLGSDTYIMCPRELNRDLKKYPGKTAVEFSILEKFFAKYRQKYGGELHFLCDKLGGVKNHRNYFDYLKKFRINAFEEGRNSFYEVENFGKIEFIQNGDSLHFPVALSSIFGKVVREIFVERMNDFFIPKIAGLTRVSGYNDDLTAEFIKRTFFLRKKLKIPDECFLRSR